MHRGNSLGEIERMGIWSVTIAAISNFNEVGRWRMPSVQSFSIRFIKLPPCTSDSEIRRDT